MSSTSSSDTESESDIPNPCSVDALEFARMSTQFIHGDQSASSHSVHPGSGTVRGAAEQLLALSSLSIDETTDDDTLHEISRCSSTILGFLQDILDHHPFQEHERVLDTADLLYLVQEDFLMSLFDYRQLFYRIASQECPRDTAPSVIICWVDVILARLGEVVCVLAAEAPVLDDNSAISASLKKQYEDDSLRAAAQLPEKWLDVLQLMASDHASSASIRLAIRLTFGVKVIAPRLECTLKLQPSMEASISSSILHALGTYINRLGSEIDGSNDPLSASSFPGHHKVTAAMAISIFATMHLQKLLCQDTTVGSPFLPHTLRNILRIIELLIAREDGLQADIMDPHDTLDAARTILVRWGDVMSFCWLVWDDPRFMGAEIVTYLTSVWLHHSESTTQLEDDLDQTIELWYISLAPSLLQCPAAATGALLRLLQHLTGRLCSSSLPLIISDIVLDVVTKSCWAVFEIIRGHEARTALPLVDLGVSLLSVFVLIADTRQMLPVRRFMIDALNVLGPEALAVAFKGVQAVAQFDFGARFDSFLAHQKRQLLETQDLIDDRAVGIYLRVNMALNFLAVLIQSGSDLARHHHTASYLLCASTEHVLSRDASTASQIAYVPTLLAVLAVLQDLDSEIMDNTKPWEDERLGALVLTIGDLSLVLASAAAQFLLSRMRRGPVGCLRSIEIWDFARDILIFIMSRHYLGDGEPLALLIAPTMARVLLDLLDSADPDFARFMISFPWNLGFCTTLRNIVETETGGYMAVLRRRLSRFGPALLEKINVSGGRSGPENSTNAPAESPTPMKLIFYCACNILHPIWMCDLVDQE
ncbi:hypothetical protein OE88DRAFT_118956 [Heliocybe sulcata]|uniref:Uncharacterized protein n=1 Tax=Heliocybe sulcata TaxID=5364 RepID=A0A5C3NJA1_9AGAM|nr:hypothetical protein OE88DRAFT_118956 [Heliocybe sulcata]